MKKVSAAVIHEHGDPESVVAVEKVALGQPKRGEVVVDVRAAPINPADLNVIEGKYPDRPELPATPGMEGVAVVSALGPDASGVAVGDHVLLPPGLGSWREAAVVAADALVIVPHEVPLEQAAMLRVNPPTAWRMLHDFVEMEPGGWIIQNAANSGVGRAVIQIARTLGWRTINVVRREELLEEMRAAGGDVVLLESAEVPKKAREAAGGEPIHLALNAVGGDSALGLAGALAAGGTLVTYGAMGRQPVRIPNGLLIFEDLRFRGFWVSRWYREADRAARDRMFAGLFPLARAGVLHAPVAASYPLAEVAKAIQHAKQGGRAGKVLLEFEG